MDVYDIGDGKTMMHMRIFNEEGKLRHVITYIGHPEIGFVEVACSKNLDAPGVDSSYRNYHNSMMRMLPLLIGIAESNMSNWNTIGK